MRSLFPSSQPNKFAFLRTDAVFIGLQTFFFLLLDTLGLYPWREFQSVFVMFI
eukprot:m.27599 g.27599  ORF g.27599 m.27599 type:complete len:53 (+) comp39825_c0_seq1:253-411(+)